VIGILAAIANQERVRRSERARAAIARLRRQGTTDHLGRPRLVIDRENARRLRREGRSVREIAAEMGISPATAQRIIKSLA
jgi:DNA invertase Pin-like site-specific DNA recombinase